MNRRITPLVVLFLLLSRLGMAQIPQLITYQGVLTDTTGTPIPANVVLTFRIYDVESGGTFLWDETHLSVAVSNGLFTTILGSVETLDLPFDKTYWLGIALASDPEMTPRTKLTSTPYSLRSVVADSANIVPWSGLSGIPAGFADGVDNIGSGGGDGHSLDAADGTPIDAVFVDNAGNVGIGTVSPTARLEVLGTATGVDDVLIKGAGTDIGLRLSNIGTGGRSYGLTSTGGISSQGQGKFGVFDFNAVAMRLVIDSTGNVGIGTTSPGQKLSVAGTAEMTGIKLTTSPTSGYVLTSDAGGIGTWQAAAGGSGWALTGNSIAASNFLGSTNNLALDFRVNNIRALRLEPNATSPNLIGGHSGNSVTGGIYGATIGGGGGSGAALNQVAAIYGTVGGGATNTASANYATVGGGSANTASANYATVGGGISNTASGAVATVGGGENNTANNSYATVGGGWQNTTSNYAATVAGGTNNAASGSRATVGGGQYNTARGLYAVVSGGGGATAIDSNAALGDYSAIGGGQRNKASASNATVGGGFANTASGSNAFVGGGTSNTASGNAAIIGGGQANNASGVGATVSGGSSNTVSANGATVGGGNANTASGSNATVPGGYNSVASGDYSFATGYRAKANHDGSFVWADSTNADFTSTAEDQFLIRASGGVGIGTASPSNALSVAGGADFSGNVGIGITNPSKTLTVNSGNTITGWFKGPAGGTELYIGSAEASGDLIAIRSDATNNRGNIRLWGDTEANGITIISGGDVGIGTTTPDAKLHVAGGPLWTTLGWQKTIAIDVGDAIKFGQDGTTKFGVGSSAGTLFHWYTTADGATGDSANYYMIVNDSGQVGIGDVPNPIYEFYVTGAAGGTTIWTSTSDLRYKKNVRPLEDALEKVLALRGVRYDWRRDEFRDMKFNDRPQIGVIAQEVETVLPEIVTTDAEGYKSVAYGTLTAVLIEAVKAQQQQIEELQSAVAELQEQVQVASAH